MLKTSEHSTVERKRTGVSVIELCEAGRYREAAVFAEGVSPTDAEGLLGLGMVEIARGSLTAAKDYLSKLAFSSEALAGRAKVQLAVAYWYGGETAEAKDLLRDLDDTFEKLLLKAIIEARPKYALRLLDKAAGFEVRPGMAGRLHNQRALIFRNMGKLDEAIQEYEAALYFFEQDQSDCIALVLNNLARVYFEFGDSDRALEYANRAVKLLKDDSGNLGKALDEKSRILLAQGKNKEAGAAGREAIAVLRAADRKEWLVEALLTHARVLRADEDQRELEVLREAEAVCRFLDRQDLLIDVLRAKMSLAEIVLSQTECRLLETALRACNGSYRSVAVKLHTSHPRIMRLVKKHKIDRNL